jgi:hypothetical protein
MPARNSTEQRMQMFSQHQPDNCKKEEREMDEEPITKKERKKRTIKYISPWSLFSSPLKQTHWVRYSGSVHSPRHLGGGGRRIMVAGQPRQKS